MGSECGTESETGRALGEIMAEGKYAAIVLSAGRGKRMNSTVPKQYLKLEGKPVLYYSLLAFERSMVSEVIVVTGEEDITYCKKEIIEKYGLQKVKAVVAGGKERYHSVFCGLKALQDRSSKAEFVMIHDGARPFVDQDIITRCAQAAEECQACVAAVPAKDTVKIADDNQFALQTPKRSRVWMIQTPQVFARKMIYHAYQEIMEQESRGELLDITDDAMVVETVTEYKVKMVEGSYENIKITTPEDLKIAEVFCKSRDL